MHARDACCVRFQACLRYLPLCLTNRPITTFLPLAIVLGVSMFKEALEDIQRFQADREVNRRGVLVYSDPSNAWVRKQWRDIIVRAQTLPCNSMHALCVAQMCTSLTECQARKDPCPTQ